MKSTPFFNTLICVIRIRAFCTYGKSYYKIKFFSYDEKDYRSVKELLQAGKQAWDYDLY